MKRLLLFVRAAGATLLLAGCGGPTEPSGALEGITIYENTRFGGTARTLGADERDFQALITPTGLNSWDNSVSSLKVSPGWSATLYEDPNFLGATLVVTADIPNLHDVPGPCGGEWDDCISSIRVVRP